MGRPFLQVKVISTGTDNCEALKMTLKVLKISFFVQSVEDGRPRYTCKTCRCVLADMRSMQGYGSSAAKCCRCVIASKGSLVWEGYMGTNLPAVLFRREIEMTQPATD